MHPTRAVLLLIATCLVLPAASAPTRPVQFTAHQLGVGVTGGFRRVSASGLQIDPAHLSAAKGSVSVDANSIELDAGDYSDSLKEAEWLDTAHFPQASFTLDTLAAKGGSAYEARGALSIKGVRRPVTVPLEVTAAAGGGLHAHGSFSIQRLDYKLGTGDWADTGTIDNAVTIQFDVPLAAAAGH